MNRGRKGTSPIGGYTIVETLIFLAVSAAIFFAAMMYVSGRQNREYFITAVRDFETKLLDVANDVATGYYQRSGSLGCAATAAGPTYSSTGDLGKNESCIFVGTVLKLGDNSNKETFTQFALGGLRQTGGANTVNLAEAKPKVINQPSLPQASKIGAGVTVECIAVHAVSCTPSPTSAYAALGFFTTFDGASLMAQNGGVIQANLIAFSGVRLSDGAHSSTVLDQLNNTANYTSPDLNPGAVICLKSGGTNQYALITIGGNNSTNLATKTEIKSISGASPLCS